MELVGKVRVLNLDDSITSHPDSAQVNVAHIDHARTTAVHGVTSPAPAAMITDSAVAGTVYSGRARPGTAQDYAGWQISKTVTVGAVVTTTWARVDPGGGAALSIAAYEHVWNDRASLTYV